jgi:hypothetical protein
MLMDLTIAQLDLTQAQSDPETAFRVINNATWSCGEIAMRQGPGMTPYIDRLLEKLGIIMFSEEVPQSLNENAAIALGRLGIGCHDQLAPHLAEFGVPFLKSMRQVGWTDEKGHAYKGFSHVVLDNPKALEPGLLEFFSEMANAPGIFLTGMQEDGPLRIFEKVLAAAGAGAAAALCFLRDLMNIYLTFGDIQLRNTRNIISQPTPHRRQSTMLTALTSCLIDFVR